MIHISVRHTSN